MHLPTFYSYFVKMMTKSPKLLYWHCFEFFHWSF